MIPAKISGEGAHYDALYVHEFDKAARLLMDNGTERATLGHNGTSGALVCIGKPDQFIGVLMPYRGSDMIAQDAPDWIAADLTAEIA